MEAPFDGLLTQHNTSNANIPGMWFGGKMQRAFHLKKISQLKSDIRSCRCKNFSLKQASGRIWGSGPEESDSGQTITAKKPRLNR